MTSPSITYQEILHIFQESANSLCASGIADGPIMISADTPIFGGGSNLDSMAFISLISDIEDSVNRRTNRDIYIVLTDIEELYPSAPFLSAGMLVDYILLVLKDQK